MKIIQLTAENVKKLTAVEITPKGNMVQITGKNGAGKTSVLDAIHWALVGTAAQSQPIRKGAEKARIELKLGDGDKVALIVERRFTDKGNYLSVTTADGMAPKKPQNFLNDLLGAITLDPLDFMRRKPDEQANVLKSLVKLDIDLDATEAANDTDRNERTIVNRDAKSKRAQADAITVAAGLPAEPIDEADLLQQIETAAETNADIERRRGNREQAKRDIAAARKAATDAETALPSTITEIETARDTTVADYEAQITALQAKITGAKEAAETKIATARKECAEAVASFTKTADDRQAQLDDAGELEAPVDVSGLTTKLTAAQATNRQIAERARKAKIVSEAEALEAKSKALTKAIEDRLQAKADAIAKADMPVAGLSLDDGVVTFNGIPLDQASDAEQLMISTAIAAALNPKLRILRLRDGSLLDDDAMKRLEVFADERDYQIWIERVDGSGTVGIVMEDGHVRGQEAKAVQAAE